MIIYYVKAGFKATSNINNCKYIVCAMNVFSHALLFCVLLDKISSLCYNDCV